MGHATVKELKDWISNIEKHTSELSSLDLETQVGEIRVWNGRELFIFDTDIIEDEEEKNVVQMRMVDDE